MSLVDLMELPRLIDPQLAPDGSRLLYTLARADWNANRRIGHIWLQPIAGGPASQITFGSSGEVNARWSPDGRTILFLTRRSGDTDTQIYLMPADGGEARAFTHHETSVALPAWAPDGSAVYFVAPDARGAAERGAAERRRDNERDDVFAFDENYKQRHLWKVDVATGKERKLTTGDSSVLAYRVSRGGNRIVLHRAPSPLSGDEALGEVWVMDASGEGATRLTSNSVKETEAELSPDERDVLFIAGANDRFEAPYDDALFVVPASGGRARVVLPDFPHQIFKAVWAPDGRSALAVVNMGVHTEVFQIDIAGGRARQLTNGRHTIPMAPGTWSVQPAGGRMIFQLDEPDRLGDVWTLALDGGAPTRVTGVFDAVGRDFRVPRQETIAWRSGDGTTVEGLLFYPIGYQPGTRYPLIVQLHGGPHDSDRFGMWVDYGSYIPALAAKGYAVLRPNYRGSSGYGNAFLRDLVGGYFTHQHLDVLAGVDAVIARGVADPDRLGVMGFSAGAHLVNKLITFTDRFKAAASAAGAANWVSMFAQTDERPPWRISWFGGTPWQDHAPIDTFWDHSPLKDIAKVRTPTLFFAGQDDARVPMAQSVEMYRGLRANGVPTILYVAPREPHVWSELRHQLFKMNAELEWFERYLMGRPYVRERPPSDTAGGRPTSH